MFAEQTLALAAQTGLGSATVPGRYHRRPADDGWDVSGEDAGHCARDARAPHLPSPQMVAVAQVAQADSNRNQGRIRPESGRIKPKKWQRHLPMVAPWQMALPSQAGVASCCHPVARHVAT